ncbi:MFS transporter [Pseudoroseomonas wenyumeiae]|uniref:MFS transporter n=1 Tax=Teichococcus wenyumeiae TaxID=2478470 RepID=A0A3A9JNW9_9PROT|nr:MFS transporter [Pseudoroseomonas wenyumeiae]RKK02318.1 MFS transporter [Pseudoroseomonas wenyumeiae]RMI19499.1 MFS transporter [Pseudoroseomonas wenyumeiae]
MPIPPTTRVVLALGTAQTLAWASSYYLPAILARPMAASLGLSSATLYGFFSAALLLSAVLGPWFGRLVDRHGGRGVLLASNLIFAAGLGCMALAQGPLVLGLAWALVGVGMACGLYETAFATLAGLFGKAAKGPITGITLIAGFASTLGWPLSTWMEAEWGWRGACAVWALLHLLLGLPLQRWLVPAAPLPAAKSVATVEAEQPALRHAMAVLIFFSAAVTVLAAAIGAHLPALVLASGATAEQALLAASLMGPAQVAARLLQFGPLGGLHPLVLARLACLAQLCGGLALLVFGAPAAIGFVLLCGAGNGLQTIAKGTLPLAVFGPAGYGGRQGLIAAPGLILQAGTPVGFGMLLAAWGVLSTAAIVALALAALLSLLLLSVRDGNRSG